MFFKKKPKVEVKPVYKEMSFRVQDLQKRMDKLAHAIYEYEQTDGFKVLREFLEISKNVQLLNMNRMKPGSDRLDYELGKLHILTEVLDSIERVVLDFKTKERFDEPGRKTKREYVRRSQPTAGVANF